MLLLTQTSIHAAPSYNVTAVTGSNPGQVVLTWTHFNANVKNYNLLYGPADNKTEFGAVNIDGGTKLGNNFSYTVSYLNPNQEYFFTLVPVENGKALPVKFQVSAKSKGGVVTLPASAQTSSPAITSAPQSSITADSIRNQGKGNFKSSNVGLHGLTVTRKKSGEVTLTWKKVDGEDGYSIVYGTKPGREEYGALNIGNTTSFTVKDLKPGQTYYFALAPSKNHQTQYITQQVSTNPSVSNSSSGSSQPSLGGNGSANQGSSGTGSNSTTTTTVTPGGTDTSGSGGGTTTTTTTNNSGNGNGNTNPNGTSTNGSDKEKRVKGIETQIDEQPTLWDLIRQFLHL